ncbi:MAG: PAS domain S-box protein [Paracoccaceae bacterium]
MYAEHNLLAALKVPAYTTDTLGNITFYNEAAALFWGVRPEIGTSKWCGSWKLFMPDGTSLAHEDCPMAVTLRSGRAVVGAEAALERPDGPRVSFMPYPSLVWNGEGVLTGAVNLLVDLSDRDRDALHQERLAAIVSSSDDIIISKTLDGIVTSWNSSATRILGFEEAEMIGQSMLKIVPAELAHEEAEILDKIRSGERIQHFDTERLAKDGTRVQLSLTVSPLRDRTGRIVGASQVARNVTERKRSEELQRLLFGELNHRVKNTLATIQAIAAQSLRRAASPAEFVASFSGRVQALARAHDLLVRGQMKEASFADLMQGQVVLGSIDARISQSGPDIRLDPQTVVQVALVLHELATNARKFGALSVPHGTLNVSWILAFVGAGAPELVINWKEGGMTNLTAPTSAGFGSTVIAHALEGAGGITRIEYHRDGLTCQIRLPLSVSEEARLSVPAMPLLRKEPVPVVKVDSGVLKGRKILVVEDEAIIAMDICDNLDAMGLVTIGPARSLDQARHMVKDISIEAALLDANLNGDPVGEIAAALTARGIPFAFVTGYGREALPAGYRNATVLSKPFGGEELVSLVRELFKSPSVVSQVY